MKITFLGTGAADWTGAEGAEARAYTSALFDDSLLIDGTRMIAARAPGGVTDVLITHSHRDHCDPQFFESLAPARVHAHESWAGELSVRGARVCPFSLFAPFEAAGFSVTALPANHSTERAGEQPVHFLLERGGKRVFYATDGAWLLNAEWHALRGQEIDAAVFDATIGEGHSGDYRIFEHNSIEMLRIMAATLRAHAFGKPALREGAPIYLTHMARTLHPAHAELLSQCAGAFIPARDGMTVEI